MTVGQIISKIRRKGDIRLGPRDRIQTRKCSAELRQLVRLNEYAVKATLREELASRKWEASGHDPRWWEMDNWSAGTGREHQEWRQSSTTDRKPGISPFTGLPYPPRYTEYKPGRRNDEITKDSSRHPTTAYATERGRHAA